MAGERRETGKKAEAEAVRFLRKQGYQILACNYKNRAGEIDIIAKDGDTIVFVEVKSKKSSAYLHPKYSVTYQKQRKISMVALAYLKATRQSARGARFDVVTLIWGTRPPTIEWIKSAFELAYP